MLLDVDQQIPPGHPLVIVGKRIEKLFGGKYMTVIGFYPKSGTIYTPAILGKVKRVTEALEKLPGVKPGSVLSLMSPRVKDVAQLGGRAGDHAARRQGAAERRGDRRLPRTGEGERLPHQPVRQRRRPRHRGAGRLRGLHEGAGARRTSTARLEAIVAPEREAGLEILPAGAPTVLHWLLNYTRRVALLFVLALAMIGYLHYRAFRTIQGMIIPLVTAIMGVVWALGLMGLVGAPMDPWNIMTPILLLAIGAGHSVQILKRYYEEYARARGAWPELSAKDHNRLAVVEATTKVGLVMMAAGTIAALSFGSLAAFGLPTIKNFGLCTAFGIVAALTVEMTFIPAIRVLMKPPSERQTEREQKEEFFDPILEKLADIVRSGKERPILWVFSGDHRGRPHRAGARLRGRQQPGRAVLREERPRARVPHGRRAAGRDAGHPGARRGEGDRRDQGPRGAAERWTRSGRSSPTSRCPSARSCRSSTC